jgi:DDE superfamily endonuclease
MWCVAEVDEAYVARMEELLKLYEKPYLPQEPVVCFDEKPVPLHAEVRQPIAAQPGKPAKQDGEYKRCGTANVFCAVEPLAGRHFTWPTPNRSGVQFAKAIQRLADQYPLARTIHLVVDNLSTHSCKILVDHFGPQHGVALWNRFTVHYTPKHASWLNQGEIEISLLARQCFGKRRIPSLSVLKAECRAWNRRINRDRTTIHWKFTRREARRVFHYQHNLFTRSRH